MERDKQIIEILKKHIEPYIISNPLANEIFNDIANELTQIESMPDYNEDTEAMFFIINNPDRDKYVAKNIPVTTTITSDGKIINSAEVYWNNQKAIADKCANKMKNQ